MGAYGTECVHNREPERSRVTIASYNIITVAILYRSLYKVNYVHVLLLVMCALMLVDAIEI